MIFRIGSLGERSWQIYSVLEFFNPRIPRIKELFLWGCFGSIYSELPAESFMGNSEYRALTGEFSLVASTQNIRPRIKPIN